MSTAFVDIVENVKQLSNEEKIELKSLLDKYLIEERRESILRNYHKSLDELENNTLEFSSDMDQLERMLND